MNRSDVTSLFIERVIVPALLERLLRQRTKAAESRVAADVESRPSA